MWIRLFNMELQQRLQGKCYVCKQLRQDNESVWKYRQVRLTATISLTNCRYHFTWNISLNLDLCISECIHEILKRHHPDVIINIENLSLLQRKAAIYKFTMISDNIYKKHYKKCDSLPSIPFYVTNNEWWRISSWEAVVQNMRLNIRYYFQPEFVFVWHNKSPHCP